MYLRCRAQSSSKVISKTAALRLDGIGRGEAGIFSPCSAQLPFAIDLPTLDFFFAQYFDSRFPVVTQAHFVEPPSCSNACCGLSGAVKFTGFVFEVAVSVYTAANDAEERATIVDHFLFEPQARFVDSVRHAGNPFATKS